MKLRLTLAACACAGLVAVGASGANGAAPPGEPRLAGVTTAPAQFDRVVFARVYQTGGWTALGETPTSVGHALAQLDPSWVATLLRYPKNTKPRPKEVQAWNTITGIVRASSPHAQFDVELNAMQYRKTSQILRMMSLLRTELDPDGWTLDFYTPAYRKYPEVVEAAIADAHENGEWIGGNAFRLSNTPRVPPGSDFTAVQDFGFKLDLKAVKELAAAAPVVYHLNNTPELANSDGCKFIDDFTTQRRAALLKQRAAQQTAYSFRVGYPVLFPECERGDKRANPTLFAYNAMNDGNMIQTIGGLLDQYEALAAPPPVAP